jgi:hypothetical protein
MTAALAVAVSPAAAGGYTDPFAVKKCNTKVSSNLKITQVRNMRCRGARRVMRRYDGSIARNFKAPNGFSCKLIKGRPISGVWRCKNGKRAFRFAFGD